MTVITRLLLGLALLAGLATGPALAGATDPLFINLTTDDGHRATMALNFGAKQLERGHPLTVFLNDRGVMLGSRAKVAELANQQQLIEGVLAKGATIIACPMCMKHHGVDPADLLPGIQTGNPDLTGDALFQDNTKTLTW
jgi:sulfur relay (sulfurtransferase) complex TusBCD TusD component (DsrE family)